MGYRIYIAEGRTRFYLYDWVVCDDTENPQFTTKHDYAMTFTSFAQAVEYRRRMVEMGYAPHIE